jgi:hypothetical protein
MAKKIFFGKSSCTFIRRGRSRFTSKVVIVVIIRKGVYKEIDESGSSERCVRIVPSRRKWSLPTTMRNRRNVMYVCMYKTRVVTYSNCILFCCLTGVCLVENESSRRTDVIGPPNFDGSRDHGLFQINDHLWCNDSDTPGKGCNVTCARKLASFYNLQCLWYFFFGLFGRW